MAFIMRDGHLHTYKPEKNGDVLHIPADVTSISGNVFKDCEDFSSVVIPEGVTYIGQNAFRSCRNLKSVSLPERLKMIDPDAFRDCAMLEQINIPEGLQTIGRDAFRGTKWQQQQFEETHFSVINGILVAADPDISGEITVPEGVRCIGDYAFYQHPGITKVTLPEGVELIGLMAFAECPFLKEIVIPGSVTRILDKAFIMCKELKEFVLPEGVKQLDGAVFWDSGLVTLTIPASLDVIAINTFLGCAPTQGFIVSEQNANYAGRDGVLYSKNYSEILRYPNREGKFTIPEGVTKIGFGAFEGCTRLTGITIPEGVASIGRQAFF